MDKDVQNYFEALRNLGTVILANFKEDVVKATENINLVSDFLTREPEIIPFITNPVNSNKIAKILPILNNDKMKDMVKITKVMAVFASK